MFDGLKKIIEAVKVLSKNLDMYEKDCVVQAMPSVAFVNRAKKCIENGEFKLAEKILEEAMELPQEDALVYKYLGIVCEKTGRLTEAIVSYKKSANLNTQDKDIWRLLGFALINANLAEEAEEAFENANKMTSLNTDVYAGWGMALMKQKRYEEALDKFLTSVKINKYNFMALLMAAIMEVRLGKYNDAEAKLTFLTGVNSNDANNYEYANLKYLREDYDNAIFYAKKSIEHNKFMLPAYLLLGKLYAIKKMKKECLEEYHKAFELKLFAPNLYFDYAVTMQMFGEYNISKENFERTLDFDKTSEEILSGIALCNAGMEEIDEAEKILEGIKTLDDTNYLYTKALGILSYKKRDWKSATEKLKKALEVVKFDNSLNLFLAHSYENMQDNENAKSYYEQALLNSQNETYVYKDYSNFLINIGAYKSAQRKLRRALNEDENDLEILNLLFFAGYKLVKEDYSEYNLKETISVGKKILALNEEKFLYKTEYTELANLSGFKDEN